jgi:chromosomal replication initiation ATPase DnaA
MGDTAAYGVQPDDIEVVMADWAVPPRSRWVGQARLVDAPASLNVLLAGVCDAFGLEVADVLAQSRQGILVECRRVFCYLAHVHLHVPHGMLARYLGRERTTVLHMVRSACALRQTEPWLNDLLCSLESKL